MPKFLSTTHVQLLQWLHGKKNNNIVLGSGSGGYSDLVFLEAAKQVYKRTVEPTSLTYKTIKNQVSGLHKNIQEGRMIINFFFIASGSCQGPSKTCYVNLGISQILRETQIKISSLLPYKLKILFLSGALNL